MGNSTTERGGMMKRVLRPFVLGLAVVWGLLAPPVIDRAAAVTAMNNYCSVPPFVQTTVTPNVMVAIDFSGSMQFPAYVGCSFNGYSNYSAKCWDGTNALTGANYNPTPNSSYYGYFDSNAYYQYDATNNYFKVNSTCSYTDRIGAANCISGNLLNWATATRVDVARKVMTGGRTGGSGTGTYLDSEGAYYKYQNSDAANNLYCNFQVSHSSTSTPSTRQLTISNVSGHTCTLGSLSNAQIQIQKDSSSIIGIVDDFYSKVNFDFMYFNSDNKGTIPTGGYKGAALSDLKTAINTQLPYNGTPTGEALWEVYDFYQQYNGHSYVSNSGAISKGSCTKDPFYDCVSSSSVAMPCRKSFVLMLSDGAWNGDVDPVISARNLRRGDLRSDTGLSSNQYVTVYPVFTFGDLDPGVKAQGRTALITTAIFGGYDYTSTTTWPYPFTGYTAGLSTDCGSTYDNSQKSNITDVGGNTWCNSRAVNNGSAPNNYPLPQCNPSGTWNAGCKSWDPKKTGLPYNFFEADDGAALVDAVTNALSDMIGRVTSGTAASVLASSEGSGANIVQAIFYPKRSFGTTEIQWTGEMQNLWYYIDPYLANSSMREDTDGDKKLNLSNDYSIEFFFDSDDNQVKANRFDNSGTQVDTVKLDEIKNLWEGGRTLFDRTEARKVYTTLDGSTFTDFSAATAATSSTFRSYLNLAATTETARITEATNIVNYVLGVDQTGYRNRTVTIDGTTHVWKLGDIIDSTPRAQTTSPINSYHLSPPTGYSDTTYNTFVNTDDYRSRGMVYVGANDGMLHAINAGTLLEKWSGQSSDQKAYLSGSNLGREAWAFVPKSVLPYLTYLKETNYCHLYYVDAPSLLVDASIEGTTKTASSWKTILIGGSGLGGACNASTTCSGNCVQSPITDAGLSSYFAIDVTIPDAPVLLWEFSDEHLGFATSGPAIVRVGSGTGNGKWYVVFASGPTGPIDTGYHQFMGKSNQTLKIFVLDLKTGVPVQFSSKNYLDTNIADAFGGSLYNSVIDVERGDPRNSGNYQDDAVYIGYTKKCTGTEPMWAKAPCTTGTWTDGGVIRLLTNQNTNAAAWEWGTVIRGIGPVTTSVSKLQDRKNSKLWLYFGTGRFFYKNGADLDDQISQRALFGIKEHEANLLTPACLSSNHINPAGCVEVLASDLSDRTDGTITTTATTGWYISLDVTTTSAERVITDPLATFSGNVFFTTFMPSADACAMGGNTYLWALKYDSGSAPTLLGGKGIIQVSTGEIKQVNLSDVYNQKANRRSASIYGVPPKGQGLSILASPRPARRVMHIQEK